MNGYLLTASLLLSMFVGMAIIGGMYATPMPLIAIIVVVLVAVFAVVGIIEENRRG